MTIHQFIKARPHLIWYVKNLDKLSEESIVEHVLNYGDWDEVQTMIKILGIKKTAKIFRAKSKPSAMGRQNYSEKTKNFFNIYFNKHA
ncbi:hypothetical protein CO116_00275 [Candidatus Falkowbacteria bacterium CG_4_9_14_3_um_filter_38_19]|uniref:Uncharacterized protein n=2 Tax=Candidatus Falkowiibacteriota TaxID=1752728 RepID=A0A2M6WQI2_9BACT|nr:MAG: hypothetical protein COT96_02045 [Candidatus Falkowbacteria bacterium CG10_big_fil_rev_8_21_14_0_10_38_22]PJB18053.1 MAG: hypothetical protein CO116_00275 [Candidatus Falkowbacteria bacterium CG_4_9_14_3_um_filter_38_19]